MKTAIIIAIIVMADSAGDVLLTKGMRQVGEVSTWAPRELLFIVARALSNRYVLGSMLFMAMHLLGFVTVLSWADLSVVFPATALVYVVNTMAAKFVLKETITGYRWAGITLVCLGVGLVSLA